MTITEHVQAVARFNYTFHSVSFYLQHLWESPSCFMSEHETIRYNMRISIKKGAFYNCYMFTLNHLDWL